MRLSRKSLGRPKCPSPLPKPPNHQSPVSPERKLKRSVTASSAANVSKSRILANIEIPKMSPGVVEHAPIAPAFAKQRYGSALTSWELKEINDFREIYYVGQIEKKSIMANGFDTPTFHYKAVPGDHIAYRYEIVAPLGKGAFGEVLKCLDHKTNKGVAVKVCVNTPVMQQQGAVEVANLQMVSTSKTSCVCQYVDSFMFRNHLCIVTEILGPSLFSYLREREYEGLPLSQVKAITHDLLTGLAYIHSQKIMHCDMKPENILFAGTGTNSVRIIDFGSSCVTGKQTYNYLQSRFYRAPEVILQLPYGTPIDMWSLGCIVCELITGKPIFAGQNEFDQLGRFVEVIGQPPLHMVTQSPRKERYFGSDNRLKTVPGKQPKVPFRTKLPTLLKITDSALLEFISKCLEWDPSKRMSAQAGLKHKWIAVARAGHSPKRI